MGFLEVIKSRKAVSVSFSDSKMIILFEDGRELGVPLEWFPRLRNATLEQLSKWRLIGKGEGIHWEEIDEDISIERLLY